MAAKYAEQGLVVLAVTNEGRSLVDKFVETTGAKHTILIEESDSAAAYRINGFPSTFLIDANGKIAWAGNGAGFDDGLLKKLLGEVRLLPPMPKSLDSIRRQMEKKDFAGAKKALDAKLAAENTSADDRAAAQEASNWIEKTAARMLDSAADARKEGDGWAAAETLRKVAAQFKGLEAGDKAKASLDEIMKDKDLKREVEAGDAWAKLEERLGSLKPEQAAQGCRQFAKKWEGTRAAKKAEAAAPGYERKGKR
jgi:hypothetical protein